LALFGRRPPQRVEGFLIPASKNLHMTGINQPVGVWSEMTFAPNDTEQKRY
jgi:hypothetical protein